jgi:hypothetical protein
MAQQKIDQFRASPKSIPKDYYNDLRSCADSMHNIITDIGRTGSVLSAFEKKDLTLRFECLKKIFESVFTTSQELPPTRAVIDLNSEDTTENNNNTTKDSSPIMAPVTSPVPSPVPSPVSSPQTVPRLVINGLSGDELDARIVFKYGPNKEEKRKRGNKGYSLAGLARDGHVRVGYEIIVKTKGTRKGDVPKKYIVGFSRKEGVYYMIRDCEDELKQDFVVFRDFTELDEWEQTSDLSRWEDVTINGKPVRELNSIARAGELMKRKKIN